METVKIQGIYLSAIERDLIGLLSSYAITDYFYNSSIENNGYKRKGRKEKIH